MADACGGHICYVILTGGFLWALQAKNTGILRLKCDGTRAETRFRLSAKRTSSLKLAGALDRSTTGS